MTTTEHLNKILVECNRLVAQTEDGYIAPFPKAETLAAWRSTIAAIELLLEIWQQPFTPHPLTMKLTNEILSAWPQEVLR